MTQKEVLDELKGLVVERLKFDPRRAAEMTLETTLPKGVDGSLGLDSLDFIELSVAIEERFAAGPLADLREWLDREPAGPLELSGRWRGEHARLRWSTEGSHARERGMTGGRDR